MLGFSGPKGIWVTWESLFQSLPFRGYNAGPTG
jgi:hypothetical protein